MTSDSETTKTELELWCQFDWNTSYVCHHLFSIESMFEWSSHSSSVLSCLEERIRWWPVKHRVPSTMGMNGRCNTTPSTLGVFISSANSITRPNGKTTQSRYTGAGNKEGVGICPKHTDNAIGNRRCHCCDRQLCYFNRDIKQVNPNYHRQTWWCDNLPTSWRTLGKLTG